MNTLLTRVVLLALVGALITACSGIPLRSLPRLMKLQEQLLKANPAEFMLAVQVDARMTPPAGAAPVLEIAIRPAHAGAFEPIDKRLPMHVTTASVNALGLATPRADRRWLIYSFAPESQAELRRIQSEFKRVQALAADQRGGTVMMGISQAGLALRDPALASTRWESWLQTSRQDGFFELWSGTVADLLRQAKPEAAAPRPS